MWRKWLSSDELACRIQREYPLPEGIEPKPESLMKLLKILARVAPEQQFIKTANLIYRVLVKKTDECLKNGYMFAMSCGDYRSAQTCLNILQNKDDLSPLFTACPEDLSCLDSGNNRVDASNSILPPNSGAVDQVSAVEQKNDSINNRLCEGASGNCVAGPKENNSIPKPLKMLDHPDKPMRGRKHRFSEPKAQTRHKDANISSESESDLSPRREKQTSKQTLITDSRVRGGEKRQSACSKRFSREYDSDGDASRSKNYVRSKSKLENTDSEVDTGRSRATKKRQIADPLSSEKSPRKGIRSRRSKSSYDSSISPSPTKHIAREAPIKNKTRRVVHSDSDVLENSSKRKLALSNKNVKTGKRSWPKNQPSSDSNISSESDRDLSPMKGKKSSKQSSLSRKNEVKKPNLNKNRPGSSEQSESEDSEDLFRPSNRKRPIARPKHQSTYNKNKYSDSGEYSSPERNPPKNRRISRQQSSSDSDSDNESKKLSQNHKTNNKRLANRQKVSRKKSKDSKSDGSYSFSNKYRVRSKKKPSDDTDSEVYNARSRPSNKRPVSDCSDSEQSSHKKVKSKRSKSTHDLSISPSPTKPKARQIKNKTKRAVHSDTDVTLGSSSKSKSVNKSKKELLKSQEKVSVANVKKQAPKKAPSKAKKPAVKSVKESTVKKSGSGNKKAEVVGEKELPNPNKSDKGSSKLNSSQFMSRLKELQSSILNNTPDPLTEKKAKNSKKSPVASKADDVSAGGKKPPSAKRKKSPIKKSAGKTEPKSSNSSKAKIPDKTVQPDVAKKQRKKPDTVKGKKVNEKKSPVAKKEGKAKAKNASAPKKKTNEKKPPKKGKGKEVKEAESNPDKLDQEEDKTELSLLASDHSFMSDSELEVPMGSLSTCLNSIKRQMPRPLGSATPPLSIFLRANSDIMSDVASDTSSFDRVPLKLDDKNIVKRMAKANKPGQVEDIAPSKGKTSSKIPDTPEALRKVVNMKKKLEEQQESDIECSSFSDC